MNNQPSQFDFCPKCGTVTKDGLCQRCGYQLQHVNFGNTKQFDQNGQKIYENSWVKIIFAISIVLIFIVVVIGMNYYTATSSVDTVQVKTVEEMEHTQEELILESIDKDYLQEIDDFIDSNVSYDMIQDYIFYESPSKNVSLYASYYQLEGDIPNLEEINEEIYVATAYLSNQYLVDYENDDESFTGEYYTDVTSYITYNDENNISIVLYENYQIDDILYGDIYSMNYDLVTGTRIANSDILNVNTELVQIFREASNSQNGQSDAVDSLSDTELVDFLTDEACNIVFLSPKGLEIGYNYIYGETESGWITATITDYENFLKY